MRTLKYQNKNTGNVYSLRMGSDRTDSYKLQRKDEIVWVTEEQLNRLFLKIN